MILLVLTHTKMERQPPHYFLFVKLWIDDIQLESLAAPLTKSGYGLYLQRLLEA